MSQNNDESDQWDVYDCYCLRCATRGISVAPIGAEQVDLWECPDCGEMSMTHVRQPTHDEAAA